MNEHPEKQWDQEKLYTDEAKDIEKALLLTQFAVDHAPDAVFWIDENARFIYVNDAACQSLEYSREELLKLTVPDVDPIWSMEYWQASIDHLIKQGSATFETLHQTKHGRVFPVEVSVNFIEFEGKNINCAYARDISERKKADEALRFTQFAVDNISDIALWVTPDAHFIYANKAATELLGYTNEELLGMTVFDINVDVTADIWAAHWDEARDRRMMTLEARLITKDRHLIPAEVRINFVEFEGKEYHFTFVRDISKRKRAEEALRKANRTLAALSHVNEILVRATEESELLQDACQAIVEVGGYRMAWVGFAEDDKDKTVRPVAYAGHENGYLDKIKVSWGDNESGQCPAGVAIRSGTLCVVNNVATEPSYQPWREEAIRRGYGCSISLPLTTDGNIIGAISLYRSEHGCLDPAEEKLLYQLASDLSYGITTLRARNEYQAAEERRRALEQRLEEHKRKFYRETILSVTDGKLDICEMADVKPYISGAQLTMGVFQASDVSQARREVEAFYNSHGLKGETLSTFMVGVGEAVTNALKHGSCGGVYAGKTKDEIWLGVTDRGSGIESLILPRAVLRRGFSTKPSLGLGYSMMLDVADRILLNTGTHGTTVVLIKYIREKAEVSFDTIPDTWEGIPDAATDPV